MNSDRFTVSRIQCFSRTEFEEEESKKRDVEIKYYYKKKQTKSC